MKQDYNPNDLKANKNNYFNIAYKILLYLKYCYENGIEVDPDILSSEYIRKAICINFANAFRRWIYKRSVVETDNSRPNYNLQYSGHICYKFWTTIFN